MICNRCGISLKRNMVSLGLIVPGDNHTSQNLFSNASVGSILSWNKMIMANGAARSSACVDTSSRLQMHGAA